MINYPKTRRLKTYCKAGHELGPDNRDRWNRCKICLLARDKKFRANNRERLAAKSRKDYHRNNERLKKYGLSQQQFHELELKSGGHCGICRRKFTTTPHIDHNHVTGKVRGLLCAGCNRGIGYLQDNPEVLRAAIAWIENPQ